MNKSELRKIMINERKEIPNKKELSRIITDKIIKLDNYKNAKVIALYNSLNDEVDTRELINKSLDNKIVLLPKVINDKMVFIKINRTTKYVKSKLGILEPIGDIYYGNIDLIIVPGISFDKKFNRLGFGMGYYDKYLRNKDFYKVGICYYEQLVDELETSEHDIKMDLVITEKEF